MKKKDSSKKKGSFYAINIPELPLFADQTDSTGTLADEEVKQEPSKQDTNHNNKDVFNAKLPSSTLPSPSPSTPIDLTPPDASSRLSTSSPPPPKLSLPKLLLATVVTLGVQVKERCVGCHFGRQVILTYAIITTHTGRLGSPSRSPYSISSRCWRTI